MSNEALDAMGLDLHRLIDRCPRCERIYLRACEVATCRCGSPLLITTDVPPGAAVLPDGRIEGPSGEIVFARQTKEASACGR